MKDVFGMFNGSVVANFDAYVYVLRSRKHADIRLFKIFSRPMPLDLQLLAGNKVNNPLDIPELRRFLLKPGQVYFTDVEVVSAMAGGKLASLTDEERKFVTNRFEQIERERKINKVLDAKLQELHKQSASEMSELKESILRDLK